jgi:hypothetical protein
MTEYRTEIRKNNKTVIVYGELWDDGSGYWDDWNDVGELFEIEYQPEFAITELYDERTMAVIPLDRLTPQDVYCIFEIFKYDYWERVLYDRVD